MIRRLLPLEGPARLLMFVTMTMSLGQGLWVAISSIYAVTVVGLTPGQLGISVGVAAGLVLVLSTPLGHLADRTGPKAVTVWSFALLCPLTAALVLVQGFWSYLVVLAVQSIMYRAANSARKAMIAGLVPRAERAQVMAYIRAAQNISIAVGAGLAGLVLALDVRPAYLAAVLFAALMFLATGLLTLAEQEIPPVPAGDGPALVVLRDLPFLAFTALDGLLVTYQLLLDVVLPLWVIRQTDAPRWMSAVILLVNTGVVVALQARAARGTGEPRSAARASFQGAVLVSAACLVFAVTDRVGTVVAVALLLLGALVHALGEIRQSAGSWTIAFDMAPDHAQGQYQGTYKMGGDISKMFAPALFTWAIVVHGSIGWVVLAAAYAVLGALMPPLVARGMRGRREDTSPAEVSASSPT